MTFFFSRFIASQPEEVRQFFIFRKKRDIAEEFTEEELETESETTTFSPNEQPEDLVNNVNCTWTVKVSLACLSPYLLHFDIHLGHTV